MAVSIDSELARTRSRLVLIALNRLTMRLMERWWMLASELSGQVTDYESIMILGAVFSINSEKLLRSELEPNLQDLSNPLPYDLLNHANVSSVAAATGLQRETTRRRVHGLLAQGTLIRESGALRLAHGLLQKPVVSEVLHTQLEAFRTTFDQLERLSVLRRAD